MKLKKICLKNFAYVVVKKYCVGYYHYFVNSSGKTNKGVFVFVFFFLQKAWYFYYLKIAGSSLSVDRGVLPQFLKSII